MNTKKLEKCPKPLFYRCKCLPVSKQCTIFDFYGKTRVNMKLLLRSRAARPVCPVKFCVCFCVFPSFDCKMRTLLGRRPLLGKNLFLEWIRTVCFSYSVRFRWNIWTCSTSTSDSMQKMTFGVNFSGLESCVQVKIWGKLCFDLYVCLAHRLLGFMSVLFVVFRRFT